MALFIPRARERGAGRLGEHMRMHARRDTQIHAHMRTCTCAHGRACARTHSHTHTHSHMHTHTCTCTHAHTHTHTHTHTHKHTCLRVCTSERMHTEYSLKYWAPRNINRKAVAKVRRRRIVRVLRQQICKGQSGTTWHAHMEGQNRQK
jgi:hypothetical protein